MSFIVKATILSFLISMTLFSYSQTKEKEAFNPEIVYQSDDLIITRLTAHTYQHTSYLSTDDFGKVDCNGMLVQDEDEVVVFDTPADSASTAELLSWITDELDKNVVAVVATHFHFDCVGGLKEFHKADIPSYAYHKTIAYTTEKGFNVPQQEFADSLILHVGNEKVIARFFGEGHTKDNVIGYFPAENIMFGGCLIKENGAGKGNLEDANVAAWAATATKVKAAYPAVQLVIPGHGKFGSSELLDYTIDLFKTKTH